MRDRRILPQDIHRLDRRRTCTARLLVAAAGEQRTERKDHSDKNAKTFLVLKQIKDLLFPIPH